MTVKKKVLVIVFSAVAGWLLTIVSIMALYTYTSNMELPLNRQIYATFACNALPGAYTTDARHLTFGEEIETDAYGRAVYGVGINGEEVGRIQALCVMQKVDEEQQFLYYYDNICFAYIEKGTWKLTEDDQETLASLKELNDWGKPLNLEKCTKKVLNENRHLFPSESSLDFSYTVGSAIEGKVIDALYSTEQGWDYRYGITPCDLSANGKELHLISVWEEDVSKTYDNAVYLALVVHNKDGSYDPENYLIEFDDLRDCNEVLIEIKERNGWVATK